VQSTEPQPADDWVSVRHPEPLGFDRGAVIHTADVKADAWITRVVIRTKLTVSDGPRSRPSFLSCPL